MSLKRNPLNIVNFIWENFLCLFRLSWTIIIYKDCCQMLKPHLSVQYVWPFLEKFLFHHAQQDTSFADLVGRMWHYVQHAEFNITAKISKFRSPTVWHHLWLKQFFTNVNFPSMQYDCNVKTGDNICALFACICTRNTEGFRNTMQIGNVNEKWGRKLWCHLGDYHQTESWFFILLVS